MRGFFLLWHYTNIRDGSWAMDKINFKGPLYSASNWNTWYLTKLKKRLPFCPMIRGRHLDRSRMGQHRKLGLTSYSFL